MGISVLFSITDSPRYLDVYKVCGVNSAGDVDYYSNISVYDSYGALRVVIFLRAIWRLLYVIPEILSIVYMIPTARHTPS